MGTLNRPRAWTPTERTEQKQQRRAAGGNGHGAAAAGLDERGEVRAKLSALGVTEPTLAKLTADPCVTVQRVRDWHAVASARHRAGRVNDPVGLTIAMLSGDVEIDGDELTKVRQGERDERQQAVREEHKRAAAAERAELQRRFDLIPTDVLAEILPRAIAIARERFDLPLLKAPRETTAAGLREDGILMPVIVQLYDQRLAPPMVVGSTPDGERAASPAGTEDCAHVL